jgi:hypothetical protein
MTQERYKFSAVQLRQENRYRFLIPSNTSSFLTDTIVIEIGLDVRVQLKCDGTR